MNLQDAYRAYNAQNIYPYHMPGHKRNTELMQMDNPYGIDYTEIDQLDDLHEASAHPYRDSLLANGMRRASALFKSRLSFYLINGSTAGLMCSILGLTKRGDRVLIPRNCHKSVYNTLSLAGLHPVYIYPSADEEYGMYAALRPEDVAKALEAYPDIKLVVLVSPTFYGVVSDVEKIASICHKHDIPLLVDEAHGPHMSFSPYFPDSAVNKGADVVIHSLHKTLPVLTQASMLHIASDRVDPEAISRQLAIIESSSPSYILMASADQCIDLLETRGPELFKIYEERLEAFSESMKQLRNLKVLCKGNDSIENHPSFYAYDQGKILISTRGTSMTGAELYDILLKKYKLQMEMRLQDMVLAMTSIADTKEGFDRLQNALLEIDQTIETTHQAAPFLLRQGELALPSMTPLDAYEREGEFIDPSLAEGRIAREFVYAYPPGIPYIVPGETIEKATLETLRQMESAGISLIGTRHRYPDQLEVTK